MIAMPARCEHKCESKMQEREYVLDLQPFNMEMSQATDFYVLNCECDKFRALGTYAQPCPPAGSTASVKSELPYRKFPFLHLILATRQAYFLSISLSYILLYELWHTYPCITGFPRDQ